MKNSAKTKLLKLIDDIKNPDEVENMRVYGYTDRIGTDEYNMQLSKKRAESVRDFLVEQQQISSDKVEVIPMGKKDPRVSCENIYGNQELLHCLGANRRVEIFLSYDLTVFE